MRETLGEGPARGPAPIRPVRFACVRVSFRIQGRLLAHLFASSLCTPQPVHPSGACAPPCHGPARARPAALLVLATSRPGPGCCLSPRGAPAHTRAPACRQRAPRAAAAPDGPRRYPDGGGSDGGGGGGVKVVRVASENQLCTARASEWEGGAGVGNQPFARALLQHAHRTAKPYGPAPPRRTAQPPRAVRPSPPAAHRTRAAPYDAAGKAHQGCLTQPAPRPSYPRPIIRPAPGP